MAKLAQDAYIETERLILRRPILDDLDGWAELLSNEESARFIGGVHTRGQAWRSLATMVGSWALVGYSNFSIVEKSSGQWIGRVGPWQPAEWPGPEIGWSLLRSHWGNGFASEAAVAAVEWAIVSLGWRRMIHVIHPENTASIALAKRLGSEELLGVDLSYFSNPKPLVFGRPLDRWPEGLILNPGNLQ